MRREVIGGKRFGRSRLTSHQLAQAIRFAERRLKSGFIVYLPDADHPLGYHDATVLIGGKERQGFAHQDGVTLGYIKHFSLLTI